MKLLPTPNTYREHYIDSSHRSMAAIMFYERNRVQKNVYFSHLECRTDNHYRLQP